MRLLFLLLLLANVAAFGYIRYAESRAGADTQIALLQIDPEKMKLLTPGRKEHTAPASPTPPQQSSRVCIEWGGFEEQEAAYARAALAGLGLSDKVAQQDAGWWVYIPALKTKADADNKGEELKALGIADFAVIPENDQGQFTISLGMFSTEALANNYLAQLTQKGVRSATAGPRRVKPTTLVIRDPGDAIATRIAGLQRGFPGTQLKATICADALAAKNP